MIDTLIEVPENYQRIQAASREINFTMPSDLQTGSLLRTLVASKPKGDFLELGTGTGLSLSWIVEAMDENSTVLSIDNNPDFVAVAKTFFNDGDRVSILCEDGNDWLKKDRQKQYDLIFADSWPGKYQTLDETLALLKVGGLYIIDDMLAQPNWPDGHQEKVEQLISYLEKQENLRLTKMNWSTGIIIVSKLKS
jgi:predicted O-methyltransferase YrrM